MVDILGVGAYGKVRVRDGTSQGSLIQGVKAMRPVSGTALGDEMQNVGQGVSGSEEIGQGRLADICDWGVST